jgi:DNA primase small subunit
MRKSSNRIRRFFALEYLKLAKKFPAIPDFTQREFAYLLWNKNYMIRHQGYESIDQFLSKLKSEAPRHVYASAAIYSLPNIKNMSGKGWLGCDFVVDIDSDHFNLECKNIHDYHFCQDPLEKKCLYHNSGNPPQECPECGGNKFKKQLWLCDDCLSASKNEIIKLIDEFLIPDFGLTLDQIKLVFSGHRGYHIHIRDDGLRKMSSEQRRQFVDFFTGTGFSPIKSYKKKQRGYIGSKTSDIGWKGKIARKLYQLLTESTQDSLIHELVNFGVNSKEARIFAHQTNTKNLIIALEQENKIWEIEEIGEITWSKILNYLIKEIRCEIDIPVSIDVHRLIRLTGSIHGKTGFLVKPLDYDMLNDFDPLNDPIIFSLKQDHLISTNIAVEFCPKIRIGNEIYGPFSKGERIKLPEAVSIFLNCKGAAVLED